MDPGEPVRGKELRFDAATLRFLPEGSVRIEGRILSRNADGEIERCLRRYHEEALKEERRRVIVDVALLEWISESAVTALVWWVLWIQRESCEERCSVAFRIDSAVPWST